MNTAARTFRSSERSRPYRAFAVSLPPPAGFWRRAAAYVVDAILVTIGVIALRIVLLPVSGAWLTSMIAISLQAAYFAVLWSRMGQTAGYGALGIRLVRSGGGRVDLGTAALRYILVNVGALLLSLGIGALIGTVIVLIQAHDFIRLVRLVLLLALGAIGLVNILAMNWDRRRRMLHDRMLGTQVIRTTA